MDDLKEDLRLGRILKDVWRHNYGRQFGPNPELANAGENVSQMLANDIGELCLGGAMRGSSCK